MKKDLLCAKLCSRVPYPEFPLNDLVDKFTWMVNVEKDMRGVICEKDDTIYIVFRGTTSVQDAFRDALFSLRSIPYKDKGTNRKIKVHTGFLESYMALRDTVHKYLRENGFFKKKVIVIGHSLGGAVANLCAVDLQYNFHLSDLECITFNAPRVGNKYFTASFIKRVPKTTRFVYGSDMVSIIPPKFIGYGDVCYETHIGPKRTLWSTLFDIAKNHDIQNFIKVLSYEI